MRPIRINRRRFFGSVAAALSPCAQESRKIPAPNAVENASNFDRVVNVRHPSYGATGDGVSNDRPAFLLALAAAASTQIKKISIPIGTYIISYTTGNELAEFMIVPSGVVLDFEQGAIIKWSYNKLPLFSFINCDGGGFAGHPRFLYTGTMPAAADYTVAQYATRAGLTNITSTGGAYELSTIIMSVGSSNMDWGNPQMESAAPGSEANMYAFGFNIKGLDNAGGYATNNRLGKLRIFDYQMGVLYSDQKGFIIDEIFSDRRGGTSFPAPGHVVYATGSSAELKNKDCYIGSLLEGPNVINYPSSKSYNIGTLALKVSDNLMIGRCHTQHPEGLIASASGLINSDLGDLYFRTDSPHRRASNAVNILSQAASGAQAFDNTDIHINKLVMVTPNITSALAIAQHGGVGTNARIVVDELYAECDLNFSTGQVASVGIVDVTTATEVVVRKLTIKPSKAASASVNTAIQFRKGAVRCHIEGEVIGQFATWQMARTAISSGAVSNYARISPVYYQQPNDQLSQDAFTSLAGGSASVNVVPQMHRSFSTVAATTERSLMTTLPTRGCYLFFADVVSPDRASGRSGIYLVTWTDQEGSLNNVQQIGADIKRGTTPTALTCTVSITGVVRIGWTSTFNVFWNVQVGWSKLGGFVT